MKQFVKSMVFGVLVIASAGPAAQGAVSLTPLGDLPGGSFFSDARGVSGDGSTVVPTVDFQTAVEEVFDVQVLVGQRFPEVLGLQKETVQHTFVVPPTEQPIRA